jgi:2-dehydro-3-deoxygluconokinase
MPGPRFDLTTLGEMLVRFSVASGKRLEEARQIDVYPAGAEANVATLLARLERKTCWFGALPQNPLGRLGEGALRSAGVDTSGIVWREDGRMGTYFVEFGELPRGIQVTYDRAHSVATGLQTGDIDWDRLLDTRLVHLTGITPALSSSCLALVRETVRRAHDRGVPVSFDINYRQKLWPENVAAQTLLPLIQNVELLFCSQADASRLFRCTGSMQEVAQALSSISHAQAVIVTFAEQGALLWRAENGHHEPAVPTRILDRLGAGDALAAGVIHGWLDGDPEAGLRYGVLLSALALSQHGDMVVTNRSELLRLSSGTSTLTR